MKNKYIKITLIVFTIIIILICLYYFLGIKDKIYKKIYPMKYAEYVNEFSNEYNLDPLLIFAIIKTESNFDEKAVSRSGAIGLMQLINETAKEEAEKLKIDYNKDKLILPDINLRIGISYYNTLLKYYNNNYLLSFIAYNAGIGNVDKWIRDGIIKQDGTDIENIPFKETNLYVRKIVKNYEIYKEIYEEHR